nr:unnamed protein product [Digitaria exilis]
MKEATKQKSKTANPTTASRVTTAYLQLPRQWNIAILMKITLSMIQITHSDVNATTMMAAETRRRHHRPLAAGSSLIFSLPRMRMAPVAKKA